MTILIGYKFPNGVLLTADTKTNNISNEGANLGTFTKSEKITYLRPNMIMGTAGLASLGESIKSLLQSILNVKDEISVEQCIEHIKSTFQFSHYLFKTVNDEVTYEYLVGFLGGYDKQNNESFLYTFSNEDEFNPIKQENSLIIIGPGQQQLLQHISQRFDQCGNDAAEIAKLFSEAIRQVDSENVSKDTFSVLSFYDQNEDQYKISRINVDAQGNISSTN